MDRYNPILDHFEAPVTMGQMLNCMVAYLDKVIFQDHNRVIYLGLRLRYDEKISNTHSCPFNGVTNWGGRSTMSDGTEKVKSYPGWHGRLWIATFHKYQSGTSNMFESPSGLLARIGVHTGGGGGGEYALPTQVVSQIGWDIHNNFQPWGWDVKIFEQDWASMAIARSINADGEFINRAYNEDENLYYYVNSPWDPKIMPLSKHKAQWASLDESREAPALKFL